MRDFFQNMLKQITEFFKGLSKKDRIRLIIVTGAIVILGVVVAVLLGRTNYVALYPRLEESESGTVIAELQSMDVKYKVDGGTVYVPEGQESELRMTLAAGGFSTGDYTNEWFSQATGIGTTDVEKREYQRLQLQANVRTFLNRLDKVQDSLVLLTIPQESSYALSAGAQKESSAAVTLNLSSGQSLTSSEAETVRSVVAAGTGVKLENIVITDSNAKMYALNEGDLDASGMSASTRLLLKQETEDMIRGQVEKFLWPVFGENVKAEPSVTLNFDSRITESVEFSPVVDDEGIAVSMQRLFEASRYGESAEGVPGTDENGMGTTPEYPWGDIEDSETYRKWTEEYNYEVNEIRERIEHEQGKIERLSVSILINSEQFVGDYSADIKNLVANAVGITNTDLISVSGYPFSYFDTSVQDAIDRQDQLMKDIQNRNLTRTVIIGVIVLIIALAIIMLIRSIVKSTVEANQPADIIYADGAGMNVDYLAGDGGEDEAGAYPDIELNTKSEGIRQLEKFIERDPAAVAQLLRNWLADEA